MKFVTVLILATLLGQSPAYANDYLDAVRSFGYISGEGLACGAKRYPSFEVFARAYLVSSATSDKEQEEGMYEYNEAKAKAFLRKKSEGYVDCSDVNRRFNRQKIFKATLYRNGTIKFPDGKVIKPRQSYDVTLLYDRKAKEKERINKNHDKLIAKRKKQAQKEGIYQKIRQEELKNQRR